MNTTPVPALLSLGRGHDGLRRAVVSAKATFTIVENVLELDRRDPLPVLDEERQYGEDFILPSDVAPGVLDSFQVMLVGHVQLERPARKHRVAMSVGTNRREIEVFGDRRWVRASDGGNWRPSEPALFDRMPLSWSRAYGGALQAEVDHAAVVPMVHASNPLGKGYWPEAEFRSLRQHLELATDDDAEFGEPGELPNLEESGRALSSPAEQREVPACWAPMPVAHAARYAAYCESLCPEGPGDDGASTIATTVHELAYTWAHPSWVLRERPPEGTRVVVTGLAAHPLAFVLPSLEVVLDAMVGERTGSRALLPQMMVVLADERRVTVTYRLSLAYPYREGQRRALRLRVMGDGS